MIVEATTTLHKPQFPFCSLQQAESLQKSRAGTFKLKSLQRYDSEGFEEMWLVICDPAGTRTQDPYIKSVLLYQLSYGINPFFGIAKIQ